ncbi:uncharacterized protein LOC141901360 isoform X2 [Tubulanus polymorphus]|uniref:uncharacterized protein LOC141901360 isoform X2 n=1 Tax=Tubulanus polymorphus TaxID=672921 RepID=UPI003DA53737
MNTGHLAYSRKVLQVGIAQICQQLGWNSIQSSALELMTDIIERYLTEIGKSTHRYCEQFGRTEPNLDDVALAFQYIGIPLSELEEYAKNFAENVPYPKDVVKFPKRKRNQMHFPKAGSKELESRDENVHDHLPVMHREWGDLPVDSTSRATPDTRAPEVPLDETPVDKHTIGSPDTPPPAKRQRILPEEAGHSQYEMMSVVLSSNGLLTPNKETGKLPDARTPPQTSRQLGIRMPDKPSTFKGREKTDSKLPQIGVLERERVEKTGRVIRVMKPATKVRPKKFASSGIRVLAVGNKEQVKAEQARIEKALVEKERLVNVEREKLKKKESEYHHQKKDRSKFGKEDEDYRPPAPSRGRSPRGRSPGRGRKSPGRSPGRSPVNRSPGRGRSPKGGGKIHAKPAVVVESRTKSPEQSSPERPSKSPDKTNIRTISSSDEDDDENASLVITDDGKPSNDASKKARLAAIDDTFNSVLSMEVSDSKRGKNKKEESSMSAKLKSPTPDRLVAAEVVAASSPKLAPPPKAGGSPRKKHRAGKKGAKASKATLVPTVPVSSKVTLEMEATTTSIVATDDERKELVSDRQTDNRQTVTGSPAKQIIDESPEQRIVAPLKMRIMDDGSTVIKGKKGDTDGGKSVPRITLKFGSLGGSSPVTVVTDSKTSKPSFPKLVIKTMPPSDEETKQKEEERRREEERKKKEQQKREEEERKRREEEERREAEERRKEAERRKEEERKRKEEEKRLVEEQRKEEEREEQRRREEEKKRAAERRRIEQSSKRSPSPSDSSSINLSPNSSPELQKSPYKSPTPSPNPVNSPSPSSSSSDDGSDDEDDDDESPAPAPVKARTPTPPPPPPVKRPPPKTKAAMKALPPPRAATRRDPSPSESASIDEADLSADDDSMSSSPPPPPTPKRGSPKKKAASAIPPMPPSKYSKNAVGTGAAVPAGKGVQRTVITETVGTIIDESGQTIWICPTCKVPDDGSPMIGCDICDDWYHWPCVGIKVEPAEEEQWYCPRCLGKSVTNKKKKGPGKPRGKSKRGRKKGT